MVNIGVIGSSRYINKEKVIFVLNELYKTHGNKLVIVSGRCPKGGPDIWAEEYADSKDDIDKKIHPPDYLAREEFFRRNGLVARDSVEIHSFINDGQYESGTWNTLRQFVEMGKTNFVIYKEDGSLWKEYEYPIWLRWRLDLANRKLKLNL